MIGRAAVCRGAIMAVLSALALAGCAKAGPAPGRSDGATASNAVSSVVASAPPAVGPSLTVTPSASNVRSATASRVLPSTVPATIVARSTCPSLMIRVIRGSAAPGYEFAALQFVNTGATACVLNGYPTVTLLRQGAVIGTRSTPSTGATSTYRLAPGQTAESRLKDFSSCQAPLSDAIRVVAPGSSISLTRPGQLRACTLRVSPLSAPE